MRYQTSAPVPWVWVVLLSLCLGLSGFGMGCECEALEEVSGFLGFEPEPDLENPKTYKGDSISFSYPGNWTIDKGEVEEITVDLVTEIILGIEVGDEGDLEASDKEEKRAPQTYTRRILSAESSGNALVILAVFEPAVDIGAELFLESYSEGLEEQLKETVGAVSQYTKTPPTKFKHTFLGEEREAIEQRVALYLLGEKVDFILRAYSMRGEKRTLICVTQIAAEDEKTVEKGFQHILDSMKLEGE